MQNKNYMTGSICLSKIPKEMIKEDSNGIKWLNVAVGANKEKSQYGTTHFIKASIQIGGEWKDEFIGNLTEHEPKVMTEQDVAEMPAAEDTSDLPF